mmetsp:Transcript_13287/g.30924  ORF Transcript_13287/g.30924 Transcript_13287/m.30924 type:complete len:108 (+) Transcript_13287:571-894(+)
MSHHKTNTQVLKRALPIAIPRCNSEEVSIITTTNTEPKDTPHKTAMPTSLRDFVVVHCRSHEAARFDEAARMACIHSDTTASIHQTTPSITGDKTQPNRANLFDISI